MTKKRPIREGFVFAIIFIAVVVLVAIVTQWKGHEIIGWSVLGVLVVALAFFLYKSPILRDWMRRQFKGVTERAVFGDVIEATQSSSDTGLLRQGVRELV
jgi:cobalamin synthase